MVPFIDDMAAAYARAQLVVCRAGATTIAELTACGRPAILIPFPYAAGDHQTANARALARRGAALMLPQERTDRRGPRPAGCGICCDDRERLLSMAGAPRSLAKRGAADVILKECRAISSQRRLDRAERPSEAPEAES